jgi:hypothetical protein
MTWIFRLDAFSENRFAAIGQSYCVSLHIAVVQQNFIRKRAR